MAKHYSAYGFASSAIGPLYGIFKLAGCFNPNPCWQSNSSPCSHYSEHAAVYVTETLPHSIKYLDRKEASAAQSKAHCLIAHNATVTAARQAQPVSPVNACVNVRTGARFAFRAPKSGGRPNIVQWWPQPKCAVVMINTPLEHRHTVYPDTIQRGVFTLSR